MGKVFRDLIEYDGIDDTPYNNLKNFNQINVDYVCSIPVEKPDIEHITKVSIETCEVHKQVVKTPIGVSYEGREATGFKLLLSADIILKFEYTAKNINQSIHTVNAQFPFTNYIVLPKDFEPSSFIFTSLAVEDVHTEVVDGRCLYNNVYLLLIADIC